MLGLFGGILLPNGHPQPGAIESARSEARGAFDSIAELALFLFDADVAIVDLNDPSGAGVGSGIGNSVAFGRNARHSIDPAFFTRFADPIASLADGYAAQARVPIRIDGERVGTLAVLGNTERSYNHRDVETLRRLADLIAEGVVYRMREGVQLS